jgi:hypothetical protein
VSAGDVVMLAYVLTVLALIAIAIAGAVYFTRPSFEPALQTSLDCRDGMHSGCLRCEGCSCHSGVLR